AVSRLPYLTAGVPTTFQAETMCAPIAGRVATGNLAARVNPNKAPRGTRCDRIRRIERRERAVDQHEAVKSISGVDVVPGDVAPVVDRHGLNRDPAWVIDRGERSIDQGEAVEQAVGALIPADDLAGGVDGRRKRERGCGEMGRRYGAPS